MAKPPLELREDSIASHSFRGISIPGYMITHLARYIEFGEPRGDFLNAVLENDLKGAYSHADDQNILAIGAYVNYLYSRSPTDCWGDPKRVRKWTAHKGLQGVLNEDHEAP